jgi:uncharacterized protein (DUF2384 family)
MKNLKPKNSFEDKMDSNIVEESIVFYGTHKLNTTNKFASTELPYHHFKLILDLNVFTIAEWASLLQISERTMHRFAKEDLSFSGILTERIQLLHEIIKEGIHLFGPNFKAWLFSKPYNLYGEMPMNLLYTHLGIVEVYKIMKRLQHGIVA